MIAYKFLRPDGSSLFTSFRWRLSDASRASGSSSPAGAASTPADPRTCRSCAARSLYEIELAGDVVEHRTKLVAARARLLRHVEAWDDEVRDAYTRMCADPAHELALRASPPLEDWDAVVEPSVREGPALLGFVAARIAEELSGAPRLTTPSGPGRPPGSSIGSASLPRDERHDTPAANSRSAWTPVASPSSARYRRARRVRS